MVGQILEGAVTDSNETFAATIGRRVIRISNSLVSQSKVFGLFGEFDNLGLAVGDKTLAKVRMLKGRVDNFDTSAAILSS